LTTYPLISSYTNNGDDTLQSFLIFKFPIYNCEDQNTSDCNSTGYFTAVGNIKF